MEGSLSALIEQMCSVGKYQQIFVYSSLLNPNFKFQDYYNLASDFESLSRKGERFLFPSYTYSTRRGQDFDAHMSVPDPQNGALSRVVFEQQRFSRTLDPDFSYLVLDEKWEEQNRTESVFNKSFGRHSYHDELFRSRSGILLLGPVLTTGLTPVMHLECIHEVPWREFIKTQYFCQQEKVIKTYNYYAKIADFPKEKLPDRTSLYPIIRNLTKTQRELFESRSLEVLLFDWDEFAEDFSQHLSSDLFFQKKSDLLNDFS